MIRSNRGQAATELAVLGSLILMAFSYLLLYSEKLNRQQLYLMKNFRTTLEKANGVNGSGSYNMVMHRRMPNIFSPFQLGQSETFGASNSLAWGTSSDGESNLTNVDGNEFTSIEDPDGDGLSGDDDTDGENYTSQTDSYTDATSTFTKNRSQGGSLASTRSLTATDSVSMDEYGTTSYLGDYGVYSSSSGSLNRSRTWSTPEE